jgi:hypothetical protein
MNVRKWLEIIGLDLIPYAIGLFTFINDASLEGMKLGGIYEKVQGLDLKKVEDALSYTKGLLDEESTRGEKIDSKAFNLIGVTAISTAFVTGISSLLPKGNHTIAFLIILALLYLTIVFSLTFTILLSSRVVRVGNYSYSVPEVTDVFKMKSQSLLEAKKERLASYVYCYSKNYRVNNVKASYLMGAQLWFRNSMIAFLLLAFILIPLFFSKTSNGSQQIATPAIVATYTYQGAPVNLSTPTSSPTLFVVQPTCIILPTETPTSVPAIGTPSP